MTVRRRQHDLGPPDELARGVAVGDQSLQLGSVVGVQIKADVIASHAPSMTCSPNDGNPTSGGEQDAKKDPLVEIDAIVPREEFRPALERVWRKPQGERKSRAGRKPMDAVLMFKTLVLSALYNLSDDQIEYQVRDRLSFMQFLGLGLEDRVPDAKTVWLYREGLAQAGLVEELFRQFDGYMARQGYIARGGQILDASIVPVPRNRNTCEENKAIKDGEVPEDWADKPAKRSQKDVDARWTKKHGEVALRLQEPRQRGSQAQARAPLPRQRRRPARQSGGRSSADAGQYRRGRLGGRGLSVRGD